MLSWIIQITIMSIILIFLIHHLINFFKSTLTVPKIKDLVNIPMKKYEKIYNIINDNNPENIINKSENIDYSLIELLPKNKEATMKNELKNFLKNQLNNSKINEGNIVSLDSMANTNSYSNF